MCGSIVLLRCNSRIPPDAARIFSINSRAICPAAKRRLHALVRVLQLAPDVLLLDEPTASLNPVSARAIEARVGAWFDGDQLRACIWVSHDHEQARQAQTETAR